MMVGIAFVSAPCIWTGKLDAFPVFPVLAPR